MKVADLVIGNIYKDDRGYRCIYVGVINKTRFKNMHNFDPMDDTYGGWICTDKNITNLVADV